jgi:hypothetical protein
MSAANDTRFARVDDAHGRENNYTRARDRLVLARSLSARQFGAQ